MMVIRERASIRFTRYMLVGVAVLPIGRAARGQSLPSVRPLGPIVAQSSDTLGSQVQVRALPNGSVLVNDQRRRRLLMLDSTLRRESIVADSAGVSGSAYGASARGLTRFRGDSSLFIDLTSLTMRVIDPHGRLARTMAVPRPVDAVLIASSGQEAGVDPRGRLVYQGTDRSTGPKQATPGVAATAADTAPILRVDLVSRTLDTVAFVRINNILGRTTVDSTGKQIMKSVINPLPTVDDWGMLPDGTVAVVRGRDYHVDFFAPDGTRRVASKIPYQWQRLSDEDKVAFRDSLVAASARLGAAQSSVSSSAASGGKPAEPTRTTRPRTLRLQESVDFVPASDLPDYKPAFFGGALHVDARGNLWILTIPTTVVKGGPVYDIVDSQGMLVERVQVPADRTVLGFASDNSVYLGHQQSPAAAFLTLERARRR